MMPILLPLLWFGFHELQGMRIHWEFPIPIIGFPSCLGMPPQLDLAVLFHAHAFVGCTW
jgi:hypothetical protein